MILMLEMNSLDFLVSITDLTSFFFQEIKTNDGTLASEILGDVIKVSKENSWEIILNVRTGTIESWKVSVCAYIFHVYHK